MLRSAISITPPSHVTKHAEGKAELSFRTFHEDSTVVLGWSRFIRDHYRADQDVQDVFGVTDRTAQYWRNGKDRTPRARHITIAMIEHGPAKVFKYLTEGARAIS